MAIHLIEYISERFVVDRKRTTIVGMYDVACPLIPQRAYSNRNISYLFSDEIIPKEEQAGMITFAGERAQLFRYVWYVDKDSPNGYISISHYDDKPYMLQDWIRDNPKKYFYVDLSGNVY